MTKDLPATLRKTTIIGPDGELKVNPGRYARGAITIAFDMLGGVEGLAKWAEDNKDDFYTKMFTKVVGREVEHGVSEGVEALLDQLDKGVLENADVVDVDYEEIEEVVEVDPRLAKMAEQYAMGEPDEEGPEDYED